GERFMAQSPELLRRLADPLPVPSTSIYSRSDGVVAWRACRQAEGPQSENVEVRGAHVGLGFNPPRCGSSPTGWRSRSGHGRRSGRAPSSPPSFRADDPDAGAASMTFPRRFLIGVNPRGANRDIK